MKNRIPNIEIGKQTELDKAVNRALSRPFDKYELSGFGMQKMEFPSTYPYLSIRFPSKAEGRRGFVIEAGVKGTF